VRPAGPEFLLFPKSLDDFDGYMIGRFTVHKMVSGGGARLADGDEFVLKGKLISVHPAFCYLVRFKRTMKDGEEDFDIQGDGGFRAVERQPWTWVTLDWSLEHELKNPHREMALLGLLGGAGVKTADDLPLHLSEELVRKQAWFPTLCKESDYYRMEAICAARDAWPGALPKIRKLKFHQLQALAEHLREAPHELCYYGHSHHYEELGEMSFESLQKLPRPAATTPICMSAACFYGMLKEERLRFGHTAFACHVWLGKFRVAHAQYAHSAQGALHWLLREGHLLPANDDAIFIDREHWFEDPSPLERCWLLFPRDDKLKERILNHLRRIARNFLAAEGKFTPRHGPVVAVPKGALNAGQRKALDHILNNPITIIQGGPGSGKTALGAEHLACLFQNLAVYTHVGRQAVSLAERLGGCYENASTIHSAHHRRNKPHEGPIRIKYAERVELLVFDEVYNEDDWTKEASLSLAQEATRVVFIGDPDQILPISGEEGAGTPALDIARCFAEHVVVLNENMRQRDNARAIHDVVTCVRTKQSRVINWAPANKAVERFEPPALRTAAALRPILEPMMRRLRANIGGDEHAWQIVTFFNGFKPETQGLGVAQINEVVEAIIERDPAWAERRKHFAKINKRMTLHLGSKIVFEERFSPHASLTPSVAAKKKPAMFKKITDNGTLYSEIRNGQIEVVKSLRQVRVKNQTIWEVECEAKSEQFPGARFLVSRALHVDPSKIKFAWAITTNKSMGGECKNVAVFVPPGIINSGFDRSNLYVAVSRPIEYLGVIGRLSDIDVLTNRNPRIVTTCLGMRLHRAGFARENEEPHGYTWKLPHDHSTWGMLNEDLLAGFGNIYDQSKRSVWGKPMPLLEESWATFFSNEEKALVLRADAIPMLRTLCARVWHEMYGDVVDHSPRFPPRWELARPALVAVEAPAPADELLEMLDGEEPPLKRSHSMRDAADHDDLSISI